MGATPSSIQRIDEMNTKTAQANGLIADIVPLLDELGTHSLQEVKAYLEAKILTERKGLEKQTTKVYKKNVARLNPTGE